MDRELLADLAYLVRDLDGFDGVYQIGSRAAVAIDDDRARVRAAARLTVLNGVNVDILSSLSASRNGRRISLSDEEFAAAAKRDKARRAAWSSYRLDIDAHVVERRRAKTVLIVSASAGEHADVLRTTSGAPLTTYGIRDVQKALDALALYPLPNVVVLDIDLPGAMDLEKDIRAHYPSHFGSFDSVQWLSTKRGLRPEDTERILRALGTTFRPAVAREETFSRVRILVVDTRDASLAREVEDAAPGAEVEHVTGWEALERLGDGALDFVVAGDVEDVSLPALVRFIGSCQTTPALVIASDEPTSKRMGAAYPKLAPYFIARPVCTDDLLRVLRG